MAIELAYFGANKLSYPAADKLANPDSLARTNTRTISFPYACSKFSTFDHSDHGAYG